MRDSFGVRWTASSVDGHLVLLEVDRDRADSHDRLARRSGASEHRAKPREELGGENGFVT